MTAKSSLQQRPWSLATWIAIGTVIVVAVLTGAVSWRWQQARALTADSNRRVASAGAVLTDLTDMETGQRGYLLVGEARYLEPYAAAAARLREDLATLRQEIPGAARDSTVAEQISELSAHKVSELDSTIALQRTARHTEAVAIVRTDHGKAVMDSIRGAVRTLTGREREQLRQHALEEDRWLTGLHVVLVVGTLLTLGVLLYLRRSLLIYEDAQRAATREMERQLAAIEEQSRALASGDRTSR
jgi:CHASE3 domain sensor protein